MSNNSSPSGNTSRYEWILPIILLALAFTVLLVTLSRYTASVQLPRLSNRVYPQSDCPVNGWLNCMPGAVLSRNYQCRLDFITWARTNCPNFQGVSY